MWKKEGGYETESAKNLGVDRTLLNYAVVLASKLHSMH